VSKRVIITGAASGIGEATAEALRRRGCSVAGLDLRAGDDVIACDVRDQDSVDAAVAEAIARLGGLDVLINSAGVGDPQSATERPDADALKVIDVNLLGTWRVTAAAIGALRESRGRVINIASGLAHLTIPLATAPLRQVRPGGPASQAPVERLGGLTPLAGWLRVCPRG
jgi:NAD(P)-dependent dehydrogenase (short-subunit alcohol dehydrogenase family)